MLKATDGKGLNLTVDMLSGPTVSQTMHCTALLGRIVNIGRLAGMKAEFDFDLHARQRIDYIGVTFRTRTVEEVREILVKMRADLWDDVKAGRIRCRSTRPIRSPRPRPATSTCAPTALREDSADPIAASRHSGRRVLE